jgi:hypothetical protein
VVRIVFVQIIGKRGVGRGWAASGAAVYPPPRHRIYQVAKIGKGWAASGAAVYPPTRHRIYQVAKLVQGWAGSGAAFCLRHMVQKITEVVPQVALLYTV